MTMGSEQSRFLAMLAFSAGIFCIQLDAFALNLALLAIAQDFAIPIERLKWVVSGYLLSVGIFMLAAGRLSDGFGHGRLLRLGLALFGGASLLCAVAPSLLWLVAARVLQGLGAACLMPAGLALLGLLYPSEQRGRAIGLALGLGAIATVIGPLLGGVLTQWLGWRFIFWVNLPVVLIALACCWRIAEPRAHWERAAINGPGLLLVSLGLAALGLLLDELGSPERAMPRAGLTLGLLVLCACLFVWGEKRAATPLIDTSLLRNAPYWLLTLAGAVVNTATVVHLFVVPLSLQGVWGLSPLQAGVAFLAPAALLACGGPIAGRIPATEAVWAMAICLGVSAMLLASAALAHGWLLYLLLVTLCGASLGIANALTLIATQAVVAEQVAGLASGLTKTITTLAAGFGVILAGRSNGPLLDVQSVFGNLAACCLLTCFALLLGQRYWTDKHTVDKLTGR